MARGGPGGFDVNALMKQAQQMQNEMLQAQEKLKDETVEASAGGGMVKVTMTGDLQLREIKIDPAAIDPEDPELLQDMVTAAVSEALRSAQELAASKMGAGRAVTACTPSATPAGPSCKCSPKIPNRLLLVLLPT